MNEQVTLFVCETGDLEEPGHSDDVASAADALFAQLELWIVGLAHQRHVLLINFVLLFCQDAEQTASRYTLESQLDLAYSQLETIDFCLHRVESLFNPKVFAVIVRLPLLPRLQQQVQLIVLLLYIFL